MTQVWSNFVVTGGNGCNCCGTACDYGSYLLLPILTENTGSWYADCAEANFIMSEPNYVNSCVGYSEEVPYIFTASNGGSTLTLTGSADLVTDPRFSMWGSVNVAANANISVAFSYVNDEGFPTGAATLFGNNGNQIQLLSGNGTTLTFNGAPYTGRYIVRVRPGRADGSATTYFEGTGVISATGTMTVNQVKALWDGGGACANVLLCGNNCP